MFDGGSVLVGSGLADKQQTGKRDVEKLAGSPGGSPGSAKAAMLCLSTNRTVGAATGRPHIHRVSASVAPPLPGHRVRQPAGGGRGHVYPTAGWRNASLVFWLRAGGAAKQRASIAEVFKQNFHLSGCRMRRDCGSCWFHPGGGV